MVTITKYQAEMCAAYKQLNMKTLVAVDCGEVDTTWYAGIWVAEVLARTPNQMAIQFRYTTPVTKWEVPYGETTDFAILVKTTNGKWKAFAWCGNIEVIIYEEGEFEL